LIGMGFEPARVDWALRATSNAGLQPALDFLFAHTDDPIPDPSSQSSAPQPTTSRTQDDEEDEEELEALRAAMGKGSAGAAGGSGEGVEAKSIKCSQCGKTFKNTALANFHAEKSGHDQFGESTEEIKPLTEEEKAARLADLKAKLAEKRARKSQVEIEEAKANEAIRRKSGKDVNKLRDEMKAKEAIKAAEQARKDKLEDAKAKAAIKAQIEADKAERKARAEREKAIRTGQPIPGASASPAPAPVAAPAASSGTSSKDYKEARLQIRLPSGGPPHITTLPSESTLQDVARFLASQTPSVDPETVKFSTTYPKKDFPRSDFTKTLKELGLVPSAVLFAS